jgi:hypothetical protein
MTNIQKIIPSYSLFILFLIISGGYIAELLPCKLQRVFKENIYLKHFCSLLILIFLVNITDPAEKKVQLSRIILKSIILYIFFIFIIKTNYKFFISIIIILCFIYLLELKKQEYSDDIETLEKNNTSNELEVLSLKKKTDILITIQNILFGIIIICIIIGFLSYLGEKKYQYKNKFNFITFLIGKPDCSNIPDKISFKNSLKYSFN